MKRTLFFLIFTSSCVPQVYQYQPPVRPLPMYHEEKDFYADLKKSDPLRVQVLTKALPQFGSLRVRLLLLEAYTETGEYLNAVALAHELLAFRKIPHKQSRSQSSKQKRARQGRAVKKETLTESQQHKVYFFLACAHQGLGNDFAAHFYFEQTAQRPQYYYLYRYAQFLYRQGLWEQSFQRIEQSFQRTSGRFVYINKAYATALLFEARRSYKDNPKATQDKLEHLLKDSLLAETPAAAQAEILWKQWF